MTTVLCLNLVIINTLNTKVENFTMDTASVIFFLDLTIEISCLSNNFLFRSGPETTKGFQLSASLILTWSVGFVLYNCASNGAICAKRSRIFTVILSHQLFVFY